VKRRFSLTRRTHLLISFDKRIGAGIEWDSHTPKWTWDDNNPFESFYKAQFVRVGAFLPFLTIAIERVNRAPTVRQGTLVEQNRQQHRWE
jgi:hypothetical protein